MKRIRLSLFLLGILTLAISCQQGFELEYDSEILKANGAKISDLQTRKSDKVMPLYMPLDSIPEWVKEKVSQDEYELWEIMSTKYEIDYSILKEELSTSQKDSVYSIIRKLSSDIKDGKIQEYAGYFIIHNLSNAKAKDRIERLSRSESGREVSRVGGPSVLYSLQSAQACVYVTVEYTVDTDKKEIIRAGSPCAYVGGTNGISFNGSCVANPGTTAIVVEGSGTLKYRVGGSEREQNFYNSSVTIGAIF